MRVGHRRPLGTTTRTRLYGTVEMPELGALVYDSPPELERAYRIVGVEEVGRPGRWNLLLERISWDELVSSSDHVLFGLVRQK